MKNSLILAQDPSRVIGVLKGWDRLVFRGCCPLFMFVDGMLKWLLHMGIRLTEFSQWALATSEAMKFACSAEAERRRRPIRYLALPAFARTNWPATFSGKIRFRRLGLRVDVFGAV